MGEAILTVGDFNPRSREGSDRSDKKERLVSDISIHAPMKGATEHDISVTSVPLISIRTPTKGATIKSLNSKYSSSFQSSPPRRE